MAQVVDRGIRTQPANPNYSRGYVYTFRSCPECKGELVITNEVEDSERNVFCFAFECTACDIAGTAEGK